MFSRRVFCMMSLHVRSPPRPPRVIGSAGSIMLAYHSYSTEKFNIKVSGLGPVFSSEIECHSAILS